jgi:dihydroorotate dehydrogenase (NAD+) catalytic subunit
MLNGIGIQNPGVDEWIAHVVPRLAGIPTPVWGSAVGRTVDEFVRVATAMAGAGVPVVELNLSCPNLEGHLFALDPARSAEVVAEVRSAVPIPLGAKLSPNSEDIVGVAAAVAEAGADWVVLTNTVWGAGIDLSTRRPLLSGVIGGYSGPPLKPLAMRCVIDVHRHIPDLPILGCGGVATGDDVAEYLLAGASAVAIGTAHFADPRVAGKVTRQLRRRLEMMGVRGAADIVGGMLGW